MKQLIIICLLGLAGCETPSEEVATSKTELTNRMSVVVIDSCEYIEYPYIIGTNCGLYSLTHKGNCKYCAMRNKSK